MDWALLALVGAGEQELHALASSIARAYEDRPVEVVIVAGSERLWSRQRLQDTASITRELSLRPPSRGRRITQLAHQARERLQNRGHRLRRATQTAPRRGTERLHSSHRDPLPVGLAVEAGIAAGRAVANNLCVEVVFLDFPWGRWRGLPYPYVPRAVEPLTAIPPRHQPSSWPGRNTATLIRDLLASGCESSLAGRLPPSAAALRSQPGG